MRWYLIFYRRYNGEASAHPQIPSPHTHAAKCPIFVTAEFNRWGSACVELRGKCDSRAKMFRSSGRRWRRCVGRVSSNVCGKCERALFARLIQDSHLRATVISDFIHLFVHSSACSRRCHRRTRSQHFGTYYEFVYTYNELILNLMPWNCCV